MIDLDEEERLSSARDLEETKQETSDLHANSSDDELPFRKTVTNNFFSFNEEPDDVAIKSSEAKPQDLVSEDKDDFYCLDDDADRPAVNRFKVEGKKDIVHDDDSKIGSLQNSEQNDKADCDEKQI